MPSVRRDTDYPPFTASDQRSVLGTPYVAPRQWKDLFADFLERLPKSQAAGGAATPRI
ncbi:MAG: hypothetical protein R6V21_10585 [Pelovirga sp.]